MIRNTFKTASLVMILCLTIISTSTYAQQRGGQGERQQGPPPIPSTKQINKMVSDLADEISLTEQQEEQVLELYTNHFEEIESKTKSGRPERDEMESFKRDFENDVRKVLSEDQQELYTSYMKNNRPKRGGGERKK